MKRVLTNFLFCFVFTLPAIGQTTAYWHQFLRYRIDVTLDDRKYRLSGVADMEYVNHSPDTLRFIWMHCWPNAFRNDSTAYARQLRQERGGKARLRATRDKGWIDSLSFTVNGTAATLEPHPEWIDVQQLLLPAPLLPGDSIRIRSPFRVQLPTYNSRSGHAGKSYMVCQWFPRPAVYDRRGWHPMPYLDRGEFYNDFGDYDVRITLPGAYVVAATGWLETASERARYVELGDANRHGREKTYGGSSRAKTLRFIARNVTDFAWFADKNFVIGHERMPMGDSTVDIFAYHHPDADESWKEATSYIRDAVNQYSGWLGAYPYPVVQAVEGPKNDMSGGMEYPMITLINMPGAIDSTLDVVIAHEVGHNWLPMIVATNERDFAWMDEGLNTYFEQLYSAEKYGTIGGENTLGLPAYLRDDPDALRRLAYQLLNGQLRFREPVNQPAADFLSEASYEEASYDKTAIWLYRLEKDFGKTALLGALQRYFAEWKFRHPYPEDLRTSLEAALHADLKSYFEALSRKGRFVE
ncbi:M1 family metallopeptidase [Flaviaesturariibacter terrae]